MENSGEAASSGLSDVVASQNENGEVQQGEGQPQGQAAQRPGAWGIIKTLLVRVFFIYMISSFFRRGPATPATDDAKGGPKPPAISALNIYSKSMKMDMYVYLSESEVFSDFDNKDALFWMEDDLSYGDWTSGFNGDGSYEKFGKIPLTENVMNNGSLYLHVYFVKSGKSPNPEDPNAEKRTTIYKSKRLNKFKKRRFHTTVNLLTGTTDAHPDLVRSANDTTVEILSHWHPNLTINLVEDYTPWQKGAIPAPLDEFIVFTKDGSQYYPILYFNDYWNLNQHYMPINETTPVLNLSLTFSPLSLFKWQMYAAQGMRNKWYSFLGDDFMEESDEDQDSLKTTLVETNPYLLAITIIVSLVHSVFEFLAFKNDIQFWRNKKSLEGMSVRSVFFNVFQSLIVVLYVMDNETNFVVKVSVCIGLVIELWKITKVVDISFDREVKLLGVLPRPRITDKSTYVESQTKIYDQMAFRYLSWVLFPLLACYAVYSVIYNEHRGWYSWVLSILYGFLLMFGFIMMTPQLFINYKLKSVAHLPWRMMTYKALNTFIDDLFAFVIKMPILYRIGCFRDDIVFIIFLYQRWIYPVDKTRVNEFGVSGEALEEAEKLKAEGEGQKTANGTPAAITDGPKPDQEKKDD